MDSAPDDLTVVGQWISIQELPIGKKGTIQLQSKQKLPAKLARCQLIFLQSFGSVFPGSLQLQGHIHDLLITMLATRTQCPRKLRQSALNSSLKIEKGESMPHKTNPPVFTNMGRKKHVMNSARNRPM